MNATLVTAAGVWLLLVGSALAADPAAGKAKAAQCAACHGANGIAVLPDAPHLAGQNEIYLVKALKDYRSGARKHEQMSVMAKGLSDKDIDNLAAWYNRMPPGGGAAGGGGGTAGSDGGASGSTSKKK
ncbi:MAG: cytochrome c [Burkholderiaceae bacterium]|nr:cytochrome c [Burkholderiaceae bacterium]